MEELTDLSYKSIIRYFKTLSLLGYKSYGEVYRLIILLYIEELLTTMSDYVTENDYREIMKGLQCLYGSTCLVDFPTYYVYDSLYHKIVRQECRLRATENDIFRSTQNDIPRIKA